MNEAMGRCIDDCYKCYQTCVKTVSHCIKMGGEHVEPEYLTLMKDCAAICKVSEGFMLRDSNSLAIGF